MSDKFLNGTGLNQLRGWINDKLATKQDTLVSGTNIKTVNGNSVLGSGDLTISGGLQNLVDGSAEGSVRGINTTAENLSYTMGTNAFAEGSYTTASGISSHAEGYYSIASGIGSHAEGQSTAGGEGAHSEGNSTASGNYSHAQNYGTVAGYNYQTAIGKYNDNKKENAFEIGNGTSDSERSNGFAIDWNGNIVTKDLELTRGTIPASSNYRDKIVFTDSNDATLGYIRTPLLTDGREGIQIETIRTVNGSDIYNGIQMYINASGTPSVTLNHPAAWRTALGLEPFTPSISISSTTGTLKTYVIRQMGKLVSLTIIVYNTANVASGSNIYQGKINTTGLRPIAYTTNSTFYGSRLLGGSVGVAGGIILRNTSTSAVSTSSDNALTISFVYFVE